MAEFLYNSLESQARMCVETPQLRLQVREPKTPVARPSVCIVAHNSYRALMGLAQGHIGGVERQTALMAFWLAQRGWDVSVLVWSWSGDASKFVNGVRLIGVCPPGAGLPGLRFIHPRITGLIKAMKLANADIYYHNTAEYVTGIVAAWARHLKRKFVFSCASDADVNPELPALPRWREKFLYRRGLRQADRIWVQTNRQRSALRKGFGLAGNILPMPCQGPKLDELRLERPPGPTRVAWVGRVDPVKRLEFLLDVAERLPEIIFDVAAANMVETEYARGLYARATGLKNINWLGAVVHDRIGDIYRQAKCLCCTSLYEGFPNTFLEAWSHGRPVVSSFDPDGLIQSRHLGAHATTVDEFVSILRHLAVSDKTWRKLSRNSHEYFVNTHAIEVAMPRFEEAFSELFSKLHTTSHGVHLNRS